MSDRGGLAEDHLGDRTATGAVTPDSALDAWAQATVAPLFAQAVPGEARIGAEVEWIPVDASTERAVLIGNGAAGGGATEGSWAMLRTAALAAEWSEGRSAGGAPLFMPTSGGALSYEPGGQIEYSAPPGSVPSSLAAIERVFTALEEAGRAHGIILLARGVDPCTPLGDVPLQLTASRYRQMDRYLGRIGPSGPRMMRQTASVQVNIDAAGDVALTWRTLNAASPVLTALFANSSRYAGEETGHRSYRAHLWRTLDPARTGLLAGTDPVADYARFALGAPYLLADDEPRPFRDYAARGDLDMSAHLTTLFPEIRPRRWFEVRSIDAQPNADLAAPLVLIAGITGDAAALAEAGDLLGDPDADRLVRAGVAGLGDPVLARLARDLTAIGLAGFARLIGTDSPLAGDTAGDTAGAESALDAAHESLHRALDAA